MPLSDAAAREIADVLRKHVGTEMLEQIVHELLEIRGDKEFRDTIERLVHALGMADRAISAKKLSGLARSPRAIKIISNTSTRRSPRSISETKLWVPA